ncbi:MAG: hypothetical protein IT518_22700 [Burkholderiales bacterium]|nr:hypothetical protein [Burkholderiales bacterium]
MERWKKIVAGLVAVAAGILYVTHVHAAAPPGAMLSLKPYADAGKFKPFDSDPKRAAAARAKAYADSAKHGVLLAIAHVSFPGMGYLRSEGAGYVYFPVNYTVPR